MQLLKTDKTILTPDEILKYISDYEIAQVKEFDRLWQYFKADNPTVMSRVKADGNDVNNKVPIPYGRKIVTTFVGYAYRPRYITYKAVEDKSMDAEETAEEAKQTVDAMGNPIMQGNTIAIQPVETIEQAFIRELQATFNTNNEHIKTSRAGRNTAIFGAAYELLYLDGALNQDEKTNAALPVKAEPRFFSVDPREMILLYDYSSESKKTIAIRFYKITDDYFKVEVYYKDSIIFYDRKRERDQNNGGTKWTLIPTNKSINFYGDIPVAAYYMGDEMIGLIKPVLPLIDAYDTLVSDSMNEYDKFAAAYLIMKQFGITDPTKNKEPGKISLAIKNLKRKRVFENLPKDAEIYYLTKEIPTQFITFMSDFIRDQIHVQSHVPDFTSEKMSGASGIAIQRLLFDFENVVSNAEADFDVGLSERIDLIAKAFDKLQRIKNCTHDMISISHKRNVPLDIKQFADTALTMKSAGFSRKAIVSIMPSDIIPDVDEELKQQDEDAKALMPDISNIPEPDVQVDADGNPIDAEGNMGIDGTPKQKEQLQKRLSWKSGDVKITKGK